MPRALERGTRDDPSLHVEEACQLRAEGLGSPIGVIGAGARQEGGAVQGFADLDVGPPGVPDEVQDFANRSRGVRIAEDLIPDCLARLRGLLLPDHEEGKEEDGAVALGLELDELADVRTQHHLAAEEELHGALDIEDGRPPGADGARKAVLWRGPVAAEEATKGVNQDAPEGPEKEQANASEEGREVQPLLGDDVVEDHRVEDAHRREDVDQGAPRLEVAQGGQGLLVDAQAVVERLSNIETELALMEALTQQVLVAGGE